MNIKSLFLIVSTALSVNAFAQTEDSTSVPNPIWEDENVIQPKDTLMYNLVREFWKINQPYTYITFPFVKSIGERKIPLVTNEGKKGYKFEASMTFRIPLWKPSQSSKSFGKIFRTTFDYHTNFRMTADSSDPLTPSTQDVGLGVDVHLWNNKTSTNCKTNKSPLGQGALKSFSITTQIHHYSNGQPLGFFKYNADSTIKRNDYLQGDFSTNYIKLKGLYNILNENHSLWSFQLWGRFDGGFSDFVFTPEQRYRYGRARVGTAIDFLSHTVYSKRTKTKKVNGKSYTIKKSYVFQARLSSETIVGNLDKFEPNLLHHSSKFRTYYTLALRLKPSNNSSISGFIKLHYGRDYLNIRYDDIVWSAQAGISLPLNTFEIPNWK